MSEVDMVRTHCATSGDPEKSISELIFRRAVALVLLLVAKRLTTVHFFCEIDRTLTTNAGVLRERLRGGKGLRWEIETLERATRPSPLVSLCNAFELPRAVAFVPLAMFYTLLVNITPGFEG